MATADFDRLVMTFPPRKWRHYGEKMAEAILRRGWTEFRLPAYVVPSWGAFRHFSDPVTGVCGAVVETGAGESRRLTICVEGR